MFAIAHNRPCASLVPRLDTLTASATIGPITTPEALSAAYVHIDTFAADFRIALLEGAYRMIHGCAGWRYVDQGLDVHARKSVLIAAEAIYDKKSFVSVTGILDIRFDYSRHVLALVRDFGPGAYRLPSENWERASRDLNVKPYRDNPLKIDALVREHGLLPRDISGHVIGIDGANAFNARIDLRQASASAIALRCMAEGIRPAEICVQLRLPFTLRQNVEARYRATRVERVAPDSIKRLPDQTRPVR